MKKILCMIIALATLISLIACSDKNKYPPVESTDEEKKVMMTLKVGDSSYEVKYELYRALFLNFSEEYDGGDKSFWATAASETAKAEINERILSYAKDIFATIEHAKAIGFDAYSKEADELVNEYITTSVDGGGSAVGFEGNYDAYLASLKEMNLNYSVQTLLYRYSIAYEKIITYYAGNIDPDNPTPGATEGNLSYTRDQVKEFYLGESCVRASVIEINAEYIPYDRACEIRDEIAKYTSATAALNYAIGHTSGNPDDILNGVLIGTESLDKAYYSDVIDAAFALGMNETSKVIKISADNEVKYWILYTLEKDEAYFEEFYEGIADVYVSQKIGEKLAEVKSGITKIEYTDAFSSLDLSGVSM